MGTNNNVVDAEITIGIKDLVLRICLKWKQLVIIGVIMAIVFNAIGTLKYYRAVQRTKAEMNQTQSESLGNMMEEAKNKADGSRKNLNRYEIDEVERALQAYQSVSDCYESSLAYTKKSIKMQLDSSKIPTVSLQYTVNNHYTVEYPIMEAKDLTDTIINAYSVNVMKDSIFQQMADELDEKTEGAYIRELVSTKAEADNFCVEIMALSKKDCMAMAEVIKNEVNDVTEELKRIYGDYDISLVTESYGERSDSSVLAYQIAQLNNLNTIKNTFNNLQSTMNDDQKTYYEDLLECEEIKNEKTMDTEMATSLEQEEKKEVPEMKYFHIKYFILGGFCGIFLVCAWIVFGYIFADKLRTVRDIEDSWELPVLGVLKSEKVKKMSYFNRSIMNKFYSLEDYSDDDYLRMICAAIRIASRKNNYDTVYITSTSNHVEIKQYIQLIIEVLQKDKINIRFGNSVVIDPESLEQLAASDSVVIVEKVDNSYYASIRKELEICYTNQIPILGSVVIR